MRATTKLLVRNALRRPVRTGLTVGMVVFAVALLLLALTWISGAMGSAMANSTAMAGHVRIVDREFAAREELNPLEEHLTSLPMLTELLRRQPGVTAVEPRLTTGVMVTVGEEIGDVHALAVGASESYFRQQLKAHERLIAGNWFTGAANEVVIGEKVAELASAKVGDELLLLGMTQDGALSPITGKVVGIVRGGGQQIGQQVLLPLERLQWLTDIADGATELLVYGASYSEGQALAKALRALPELQALDVKAWDKREPWQSMGATAKTSQNLIVIVIVLLASIGIWNTMMMSVLERTHEIGVLRALGLSGFGTVKLFVGEALAIGVIGGALGVALGAWPSWLLEKHGLHIGEKTASSTAIGLGETIHGALTLEAVLTAFGMGLLMAVLGSVLPVIRGARIQPVTAMRSGR